MADLSEPVSPVSNLLCEIVNSVVEKEEAESSSEPNNDDCTTSSYEEDFYGVVEEVLKEIIGQIDYETADIAETLHDDSFIPVNNSITYQSSKKCIGVQNSILKSQPWSLGISQTGRIMDPICLQQNIFSSIAAENLVEYQWPPTTGDYYMLQEQVSTFLNITSFKRKYPEIERHKLDANEVNHLLSTHVISEVQVTLGLTAVRSADVCDLMMREYPEKYNEYSKVMEEREKLKMQNKYKQYVSSANVPLEKSQMTSMLKKAMKQAASYNAHLNRQRKEDFSVYYDMSTNVLQYPKSKVRKLDPSLTKPSLYPCALIPGQFQEYYQRYTKDELLYLPLNTAMYGPPRPPPHDTDVDAIDAESNSNGGSDCSVSSVSMSVKSASSNKSKQRPASGIVPSSLESTSEPSEAPNTPSSGAGLITNKATDKAGEKESENPFCGICSKDETCNKVGNPENLIKCSQCDNHGHPSCLEMSDELVSVILTYDWQCMECKTCTICSLPHREDLMMFCDRCDRGYHTFCVSLRAIPSGVWACSRCTFADPDFIKRRRKQLRAMNNSPSSRGRGGRRRRQRRADNRSTVTEPQETELCARREDSSDNQGNGHEKVESEKESLQEPSNSDSTEIASAAAEHEIVPKMVIKISDDKLSIRESR